MCLVSLAFVSLKFLSRVVERKRRQVYRGEVHGQLPFDPKGMDDAVPSVDFSPSGSRDTDSPYSLERADISSALQILALRRMSDSSGMVPDLLRVLEDLERYAQSLQDNDVALSNIQETRTNLQRLVDRMDALESGFDRIAERSCMS